MNVMNKLVEKIIDVHYEHESYCANTNCSTCNTANSQHPCYIEGEMTMLYEAGFRQITKEMAREILEKFTNTYSEADVDQLYYFMLRYNDEH